MPKKNFTLVIFTFFFLFFIKELTSLSAQENLEIKKIRFKGNKTFSDAQLQNQFTLTGATWVEKKLLKHQSELYDSKILQQGINDLSRFYQSEGFLYVQVATPKIQIKKNKIVITIPITENTPMKIGSVFTGNMHDFLVKKNATRKLKATPGNRFRDEWINEDRDLLIRRLTEKGFAYASVDHHISIDTSAHLVNIQWIANTGPLCHFNHTFLSPVDRTPERITRKQLAYKEGSIFTPQKLTKTQQQIYDLGTFRVAAVKAQLSQPPSDSVNVLITLAEAPATTTRMGIGYGKEDKFRAFGEVQQLNFPGGARRMSFYASHSAIEPYLFKITLTQPAVWGPQSSVSLTPYINKEVEPSYQLISYGSTLGWLQRINTQNTAQVNLHINEVLLDTSTVAQRNYTLIKQYARAGLELGYVFDNSYPRFDPNRGRIFSLNTQWIKVISGSKTQFLKHLLEFRNYQTIFPSIVLASRIQIGTIDLLRNSILAPVDDRFFAGGSRSVRGWARQELGPLDEAMVPIGGQSLLEGSIEPRFKIKGPFSMVAFIDCGNVWLSSGHFNLRDLKWAAGSGARYATPIGPIGIDVAHPIFDSYKQWQIHFNIGHPF